VCKNELWNPSSREDDMRGLILTDRSLRVALQSYLATTDADENGRLRFTGIARNARPLTRKVSTSVEGIK
jgi:hypothetical protein